MTNGRWWPYTHSSQRLDRHKNCAQIAHLMSWNACVHENEFTMVHLPLIKSSLSTLWISHSVERATRPIASYLYSIRMKDSARRYVCADPKKVAFDGDWANTNYTKVKYYDTLIGTFYTTYMILCLNAEMQIRRRLHLMATARTRITPKSSIMIR